MQTTPQTPEITAENTTEPKGVASNVLFAPVLTDHSIERAKERCNWNRGALERMAVKALSAGTSAKEVAGGLRRYIDRQHILHPGHRSLIHGHVVFIFAGATLITVFDLPHKFRRAAIASRTNDNSSNVPPQI